MKNYQFSRKLFSTLVVVIVVLTLGLVWYAASQQTVACLSLSCGPSTYSKESIALDSIHVNSPTNVTVALNNDGSWTWGLIEYSVKDSYGNMYSNSTWSGPTLSPGASTSVNILLTGKLSGQPFQLQSGHTYSVSLVTARNNQFTYSFTA